MNSLIVDGLRVAGKIARHLPFGSRLADRVRGKLVTAFKIEDMPALVGTDDPVILDVGCNDGSDTSKMLAQFGRGRFFCFEPDPRARQRFEIRVQDSRVTLLPYAVSNSDGTATFYGSNGFQKEADREVYPGGWDLSGSLKHPTGHLEKHPWCTFDNEWEVQTRRLDTWWHEQDFDMVDFMWVDVQGAERELIEGASAILSKTRFLYTEYSNDALYEGQCTYDELVALLPSFKVYHRYYNDVLLCNAALVGTTRKVKI